MLLSISGKTGSGKDTFAHLLALAIYCNRTEQIAISENMNPTNASMILKNENIKTVKIADALKDTVCRLTGCTREQLEDQDFKNSVMPEQWWIKKEPIDFKGRPMPGAMLITKPTYRQFLQELGTNLLRNWIPNIHVNATFAAWKPVPVPIRGEHWAGNAITMGSETEPQYPKWIITDMRFPNELVAVQERGGIVIRINRKLKQWNRTCLDCKKGFDYDQQKGEQLKQNVCPYCNGYNHASVLYEKSNHPSETALDSYQFWDAVIDNNGTIEELYQQAIKIVKQFKLS